PSSFASECSYHGSSWSPALPRGNPVAPCALERPVEAFSGVGSSGDDEPQVDTRRFDDGARQRMLSGVERRRAVAQEAVYATARAKNPAGGGLPPGHSHHHAQSITGANALTGRKQGDLVPATEVDGDARAFELNTLAPRKKPNER